MINFLYFSHDVCSINKDSLCSLNPVQVDARTWHTDAVEAANLVQAGGIIMARIRHAFIDVHLTTGSFIPLQTLALERAFSVDTATTVFTWIGTYKIQDVRN